MSLGDFFPDNLKDDFAKRNIDLGNALLIFSSIIFLDLKKGPINSNNFPLI